MTFDEARVTVDARRMMVAAGLEEWAFEIVERLGTDEEPHAGHCDYMAATIRLARDRCTARPDRVTEILRHEIAHAFTPGHSHDEVFDAKVAELNRLLEGAMG